MSYEPTVWNVGDTIAVAKLNRLEQGVAEMSSGYTPTVWVDGDEITAQKMNRLEQAVASGSSGGSSDFSTAEVTFVNPTPDKVLSVYIGGVIDNDEFKAISCSDGLADSQTILVPLYKGLSVAPCGDNSSLSSIDVSGSIVYEEEAFFISGDGTITIS